MSTDLSLPRRKAVLFDLDGTLLDTLEDIADAANAVLASRSLPQHPTEAYKQFVGEGVRRLMHKALPEHCRDADTIARCAARFGDEYASRWHARSRPYEGVPELLRALGERDLPLAVLSNKPQAFTQQCVDYFFPETAFVRVLGQREGVPPKPDPAGALEIAAALGLPPREIAYLGDSSTDMQTAVKAGMFPIGAAWGFRSREELLAFGAAEVIDRPLELLTRIGS